VPSTQVDAINQRKSAGATTAEPEQDADPQPVVYKVSRGLHKGASLVWNGFEPLEYNISSEEQHIRGVSGIVTILFAS
jgi:hypothetical protein